MFAFCMAVSAQITPYKDWLKNGMMVKTTFVSKSMLEMVPDVKIGNKTVAELDGILEQVEIYANYGDEVKHPMPGFVMKDVAVNIALDYKYDLLMQLSEQKTTVVFYAKKSPNNKEIISDLIMITSEANAQKNQDKCTVIRLVGKFAIDDIHDIVRKN